MRAAVAALLAVVVATAFQPLPSHTALRRAPQQQHARMPLRCAPQPPRTRPGTALRSLADSVIAAGVKIDTFLPQFFWIMMIAQPRGDLTKKVNGGLVPILACSLVHLVVVGLAATDNFPSGIEPIFIFADVFDPSKSQLEGMQRLFEVPNFVAEEWPHVLIWDLFVGRLIWLDGINRDVVCWHSLLLTNFIGPPGLVLHAVTSVLSGKGLPTLGAPAEE